MARLQLQKSQQQSLERVPNSNENEKGAEGMWERVAGVGINLLVVSLTTILMLVMVQGLE